MAKNHDDLIPVSTQGGHSAGRVEVDTRGRNVWHWNDAQIDSTSILLKRLENEELELEPTRKVPVQKATRAGASETSGRKAAAKRGSRIGSADLAISDTLTIQLGGGFDPYNRS